MTNLLEDIARRYDNINDKPVLLVLEEIASSGENGKYSDLYNILAPTVSVGDADQDVAELNVSNEEK